MSNDKRLLFGSDFGTGESALHFLSNQNFHEASLIVWQPSTAFGEVHPQQHGRAVASLDTAMLLSDRLSSLADWIRQGHTLILIGHAPLKYNFQDPQSGRVVPVPLEGHPPLDEIEFKSAGGTRIEYCGPASASNLFKPHLPLLKYDVVIGGEGLAPLLRVALGGRGEPQIVRGYRRYGGGLIVYLPKVVVGAQTAAFIDDVSQLPGMLAPSPTEVPHWIDRYQSTGDKELFAKVAALTSRLEELQSQLNVQQGLIQSSRDLKKLIFDTGTGFAEAVADALEELGLSVVEGPHPRADLLASDGARYAAVEAKGIEGTTKEKDVREVAQWMAEVDSALADDGDDNDPDLARYVTQLAKLPIQRDGSDCKGLLIMGTYRKLPFVGTRLAKLHGAGCPSDRAGGYLRANRSAIAGACLAVAGKSRFETDHT